MFGSFFPFERAAQPSELPAPPTRWRGWSRRRMSEPMWKERASEALIRAITISVCLSPAVRHPVSPLSTRALPPSPSAFLRRIASNLHSPTHFPPCHRCWVGSETEPAALWKLQSALFQNTGELVRQLPEIHSINLMPEQMNNWTGTGGGNILCIQSLTFSKKTQSLIWYFVYYLAQRYGSLNLWTQEKWAVIAGCSLFSYNLFQPKYLKLFLLSCYATLPTTGVWSMLRMRQINTTATDLVQGNMRQWHHSLNRMWMRTRLCIHFLNPSQKAVGSCSKLAVRSKCPVKTHQSANWQRKTLPHMWTAVFLNLTQNSGNCTAAKAKKASEPTVQPFFPSLGVMAWSKDALRNISHSVPQPDSEAGWYALSERLPSPKC